MNFSRKRSFQILLQYVVGWTLAFIFLSIIRGEGTIEKGSVQMELGDAILVSVLIGPVFGAISGFAQVLTEAYGYKNMSFLKLLCLRSLFAILFLFLIILCGYVFYADQISFREFLIEPGSMAIYLYIISVDVFMFNMRQVNLFLGHNNLWKLFSGQFHEPGEEERIFMFLDLQSSTSHAEKLGHIEYSKMIQDCFNDLGVVAENDAEIYQYVGDEVILTWSLKDGLRRDNCMNAYYNFIGQLQRRQGYYQATYGFVPRFKAGMNAGIVTVAEVGKYKKEIAYHGDTINTAARIQGMCNDLKKELLVAESIQRHFIDRSFTFENLDQIQLKGKGQTVKLYAVSRHC